MANLSERFQELVGDSPCWYISVLPPQPGTHPALRRGRDPDYRKEPLTAFYFEPEVRSLALYIMYRSIFLKQGGGQVNWREGALVYKRGQKCKHD
jgi:hypothetical protein